MSYRREPFRLFFPIGLLLAAAGVVPWLMFARGQVHAWPAPTHALLMTQGFLAALAVGFLGTMLPRRAGVAPMSTLALTVAGLALVALAGALLAGSLLIAELAFLLVLAVLGRYLLAAMRARTNPRPPPPSFVLLPLGALAGVGGAILLIISTRTPSPLVYALGRQLAQQGFMLLMIMAIAPMLAPVFAVGEAPADAPPARARALRLFHLAAGLVVLASFVVELKWSVRAGLLARGAVLAIELIGVGGGWRPRERSGVHRGLFRLALWLTPMGLIAAGLAPNARASLLHLTFVGGLALLALAVSVHVTLLHTGRDAQADRSSVLVTVAGGLTLVAAAVRIEAEHFGARYLDALVLAALFWLAATAAWALFVVPKLRAR